MGPFSVTGQPNAMGGREVGGLANTLAAHMEIENPEHRRIVQDFWASPTIASKPGLKAVDLFRAVEDGPCEGAVDHGHQPGRQHAGGGPGARGDPQLPVRRRLRRLPLDRHDGARRCAAAGRRLGREGRDGHQFRAARCRASGRFLPVPGEALPDWRQICEVAKRMGFGDAFAYRSPAEIFAEYARLTATENDGRRDLDLGALADLSDDDYDALAPFQWPRRAGEAPARRASSPTAASITPTARRALSPRPSAPRPREPAPRYPFILNTGRIRDQWHTMTRTAKTPRLMAHIGEPFVEIHPDDAEAIGVAAADLAEIESAHGRAVLRVVVTERQRRGSLFAPMHWTDQYASLARVDALVASVVDPVSGQPELKITAVSAKRYEAAWHAFAVSSAAIADRRRRLFRHRASARRLARGARGRSPSRPTGRPSRATTLGLGDGAETIAYHDAAAGQRRFVAFERRDLGRRAVRRARTSRCRALVARRAPRRAYRAPRSA